MGSLLEEYGFKTGVEVGVKQGSYASVVLSQWKSCQSYKLVDLWKHQENYVDKANVDQGAIQCHHYISPHAFSDVCQYFVDKI